MKIFLFSIFTIVLFLNANAQKQRAVWRMGYWQGGPAFNMKFGSSGITYDTLSSANCMSMYFSDAGICDTSGNLLFYTNGIYIADATHDTMMNGGDLTPGQFANTWRDFGMPFVQTSIVIPNPANINEYFLFHFVINNFDLSSDTLVLTKIDMSQNAGLGSVTSKNQSFFIDSLVSGQLTAVKHANGRDWWLLVHKFNSDGFILFLITTTGIIGPTLQHFGQQVMYPSQGCFSPNGEWYANYDNTYGLVLMNFNRCSGIFSNFQNFSLPDISVSTGCCFSPNSHFLYASSRSYLYQLDLTATNIQASLDTVAIWDGTYDPNPTQFVTQQLAPDNRIYITGWGTVKSLSVINFPDSLGTACNVSQHSISLPGLNNGSMPNYPFYELGPDTNSICDTLHIDVPSITSTSISYNLFPNPARNILYITQDRKEKLYTLRIFNSIGQEQAKNYSLIKNGEYVEVNTSSLHSGLYFLELLTEKQKVVRRFVIE